MTTPAAAQAMTPLPEALYPVIFDVQPLSAPVGAKVAITGRRFYKVQSVTFGNTSVAFSVKSPTKIIAIVPPAEIGTHGFPT
jgi:hypothetical protein